jgi:hypothetical protein
VVSIWRNHVDRARDALVADDHVMRPLHADVPRSYIAAAYISVVDYNVEAAFIPSIC